MTNMPASRPPPFRPPQSAPDYRYNVLGRQTRVNSLYCTKNTDMETVFGSHNQMPSNIPIASSGRMPDNDITRCETRFVINTPPHHTHS